VCQTCSLECNSFPGNPYPNYTLSHTGNRRTEVLGFDEVSHQHLYTLLINTIAGCSDPSTTIQGPQWYTTKGRVICTQEDCLGPYNKVSSLVGYLDYLVARMDRWVAESREHCDQLPSLVSSYNQTILYSNNTRPASSQVYSRRTSALERATRDTFFQKR